MVKLYRVLSVRGYYNFKRQCYDDRHEDLTRDYYTNSKEEAEYIASLSETAILIEVS